MTLLAVERIKLTSTRSPWLCVALTIALTVGLAGAISINSTEKHPASITMSQSGYQFGLAVIMVMAALAVTTEYRTGTIRTTFQAIPNRIAALAAKTAVVALLAGIVGEITAFGSLGMTALLAGNSDLALETAADWRQVAGIGLAYALGAVFAVAVGILLRHSAGAISLLLVYVLVGENLVELIPNYGLQIHNWMPFTTLSNFVSGGSMGEGPDAPLLGPWASLAYFAAIAIVLLAISLGIAKKRDA